MDDISTRLFDLPEAIRSFVHQDESGVYTIILNAKLNDIQRLQAYRHELRHIFSNDFQSNYDIDTIEINTHIR